MSGFALFLLTTVVPAAVFRSVGWVRARRYATVAPEWLGDGAWLARPNPRIVGAMAVGSVLLGLILWLVAPSSPLPPQLLQGLGTGLLTIGGVLAAYLHPDYRVGWTAESVRGPSGLFRPPGTMRVATLRFDEAVAFGEDLFDNFVLADEAGNRVRWGRYHDGWQKLLADLSKARPDLLGDVSRRCLTEGSSG